MKGSRLLGVLLLSAMLILPVGAAQALTIGYTYAPFGADLDASGSSADDLLFTFTVSSDIGLYEGFTIVFEYPAFDFLQEATQISYWDVITYPVNDPPQADGWYDVQALTGDIDDLFSVPLQIGASLGTDAFSGQLYDPPSTLEFTYWQTDANGDSFEELGSGTATTGTSPAIPEPGTLLLLGAGMIGLAGFRRRNALR